jgi:hypothetical protein
MDAGVGAVRANDDGGRIVRDDPRDHSTKEPPGGVQAIADRGERLVEARIDEHVAAPRERHDEDPEPLEPDRRRDSAHLAEVHLRLLARLGIREPHRRLGLSPSELAMRVPAERRVGNQDPFARQQLVDTRQLQGLLAEQPGLHLLANARQGGPMVRQWSTLKVAAHYLRDPRDGLIVKLA